MKRSPAAACLLILAAACSNSPDETVAAAPRTRAGLFEFMADARFEGVLENAGQASETTTTALDFEAAPEAFWFALPAGRRLEYADDPGSYVHHAPGRTGNALTLGPAEVEDTARALRVVPAEPLARVTIRGRVQNTGNPKSEDASSREVLRIYEHEDPDLDPTRVSRFGRSRDSTHRVSRRVDPSGWDTVECEFISQAKTNALELAFLHRTGGSAEAITRFDDFVVEVTPLGPAEIQQHLRERWRPRDGTEDETPWRLRVALSSADGHRSEVRDCVLLPPPASLVFPLEVAPAEEGPRLRFTYGMAPEAFSAPGDGARIVVEFRGEDGSTRTLSELEFDPKQDEEARRWREHSVDLAPVGGLAGLLRFRSTDIEGSEPDPLDAVLIGTPRIETTAVEPSVPNVLLIGVDTLRADRMSAFGHERDTTPNLARLADEGVRFARTRTQAPWTLPSFSSILTSLYPSVHGAGRGGHDEWTPIDPTTTALPEVLSRIGYETQGIVANGLISPYYGLDQGFAGYQSAWAMESAERDQEAVRAWIDSHRSTPWLLFWHIMDPHLPYSTDERFREQFTDSGYDGRFTRGRRGPNVPFEVLDPRPGRRWFTHEGPPPPPELTEGDRRFVHDYYEAEIAEMDDAVGRVLDALRESGQYERTIVAFIADHGEGLGDHDHYHHGYTLYDDQVHIPMILRIPGRFEGLVIERPVAAIDLAPTLLGALGLEVPAFFQGVDRLADGAPSDDAYFIEYPTYDSSAQKAWILGDFKYLHDPVFHTQALHHLGEDPEERLDVSDRYPEVVQRARAELDAFRWERLQKGRFHLRVRGREGERLVVRVTTDDLFDANFISLPAVPEHDFSMDLERTELALSTTLERDRLELVFWCRGSELQLTLELDGEPLEVSLGADGAAQRGPLVLARADIPTDEGAEVGWPDRGDATLWLETGVQELLPVVLSPEELEALRELGYTR